MIEETPMENLAKILTRLLNKQAQVYVDAINQLAKPVDTEPTSTVSPTPETGGVLPGTDGTSADVEDDKQRHG